MKKTIIALLILTVLLLGCTKTTDQNQSGNQNQGNANAQDQNNFGISDNDLVIDNPMDDSLPDTTSNVPDEPST